VDSVTRDALQTRIARFVGNIKSPRAINGEPDICVGTSVGAVRKQNQDRALIAFARYPATPERNFVLGVVCDGLGGLARGEEAAVVALSTFVSRVLRTPKQLPAERLRLAILAANDSVHNVLQGRGGTTIAAAMIRMHDDDMIGINVGDSRIYGANSSRKTKQLSIDDTLAGFLGDQESSDINRNRLVQYVGMGEGIEPHIVQTSQREFDFVLITSDGIHNAPQDAFSRTIQAPSTNLNLVQRLIALSEALGGQDNATALLLPTRSNTWHAESEQGLYLELWSVSDRLEIWIPLLADDQRKSDVATALTEVDDAGKRERHEPVRKKRRKGTSMRAGQRRSKKSSSKTPSSTPKEQPPLDLKFPDKRE
jgi:serine/threonine protein phosphatase PrpC